MGLHITLPWPDYFREERDDDEVDIILHKKNGGDGSLEVVGFDMDVAEAAVALGLDDYDPEMHFYMEYRRHGIDWMIELYPEEIYAAFQKQGYDVFDDEQYDASEFLNTVGQHIRDLKGPLEESIEVLTEAVNSKEYEKDELIEDLIMGLETFVDAETEAEGYIPEFREESEQVFLSYLIKMLPEKAFVFKPSSDNPMEDTDNVDTREWYVPYEISINDTTVATWSVQVMMKITDPITFEVEHIDPCSEYGDPEIYCPPPVVTRIIDFMGWRYPELPDLDEPEHPEADDDGLFGVEYVKHLFSYSKIPGASRHTKTPTGETAYTLVQYKKLEEAEEAAELSKQLLALGGSLNDYDITVVAYDEETDSWIPALED